MAETIERPSAAYEEDFYLWTQAQAAALRAVASKRVNAAVDWENVAEEIESVGRSDRRRVRSLAFQILVHLLKLAASRRNAPQDGWIGEVSNWRRRLGLVLEDSPSLRGQLKDFVLDDWADAVADARRTLERHAEDAGALDGLSPGQWLGANAERLLDRAFLPAPPAEPDA